MRHVIMFSGGIGSYIAAKRTAAKYGPEACTLLFTDVAGTNPGPHDGEDLTTYDFIRDAALHLRIELVTLNDGRTIWDVFNENRWLGNSRVAQCSRELKQKPARGWLDANADPATTTVVIGIDWTETHRIPAVKNAYQPYQVAFPLCDRPYLDKNQMLAEARADSLTIPRLYDLGFAHNNCGGGCVKAGQGQWKRLLDVMPERFAYWEANENRMREQLGDVAMVSEQIRGGRRPLPLSVIRERVESQPSLLDLEDVGGCGCFVDTEESA